MREVLSAFLGKYGLPVWLVPDYWFMVTLAIISGSLLTLHFWRRSGRSGRVAADLLFWGTLALFVGAKFLFYLQFGFPPSLADWWGTPGLSLYGGLLGLLTAWGCYYLVRPYPALLFLDCATPALAAGLFVGRIGCFLAGCNGGIACNWPWAVQFPHSTPTFIHHLEAGLVERSDAFSLPAHPTQLYESGFGLIAFALLATLFERKRWHGQVFFTGMLWYAVYRFVTEPLRADDLGLQPFGIFTFAQFVSLLLAAAALLGLLYLLRSKNRNIGNSFSL